MRLDLVQNLPRQQLPRWLHRNWMRRNRQMRQSWVRRNRVRRDRQKRQNRQMHREMMRLRPGCGRDETSSWVSFQKVAKIHGRLLVKFRLIQGFKH